MHSLPSRLIAASVIIGLWGIFVLTSFIQPVEQWLYQYFRWIPLFSTDPLAGLVATVCLQLESS